MIVPLNTPTTLDLTGNVTGTGVTGISIASNPLHGSVTVNGMQVTYTPVLNSIAADSFTYTAIGTGGPSAAATVSVTITGRPDPTKDTTVTGMLGAQTDTALRFSGTQLANFQHRTDSLHHRRSAPRTVSARLTEESPFDTKATANTNSAANSTHTLENQLNNATTPVTTSPPGFMSDLIALATTQTVNLSHLAGGASGSALESDTSSSIWIEGMANFGKQDATGNRSGTEFSTNGISIGMDKSFSDKLSLGFGVGLARDKTNVGLDGSKIQANGSSLALYGSYQPIDDFYLDGLLGIGTLNFDNQRYVAAANTFATSNRKGQQLFASLTTAWDKHEHNFTMSPYARMDYSSDRLKQATETGAGANNLIYMQQTNNTLQGALGIKLESKHDASFGVTTPRLRAEFRHNFQGDRVSSIAYADNVGGIYTLSSGAIVKNSLVLGLGDTFQFNNGLSLDVDYQHQHTYSTASNNTIRMLISKELDGTKRHSGYVDEEDDDADHHLSGVQVDTGFMFDSNVTRGELATDQRSDRSYSANVNKHAIFSLNDHSRIVLTGTLGGEQFANYDGLSHVLAGGKGEYQYRASTEFGSPIYALFARGTAEQYRSLLRDGYRYALGGSIRTDLTDRITFFTALTHNQHYGKSAVFDGKDNSGRFNFDYAVDNHSTLYLGGEYRRGDIVSTGKPGLDNLNIAKVFIQDDAYAGGQLFSYRFDGSTIISTLGYNIGFGPRDSLDLSWRRATSTATLASNASGHHNTYVANQYSLVYLVGF